MISKTAAANGETISHKQSPGDAGSDPKNLDCSNIIPISLESQIYRNKVSRRNVNF